MTRCSAPTARSGTSPRPAGRTNCSAWRWAARPCQVSNLKGDISGFKLSADRSRVVIWAERDLRCADFACADSFPPKRATGSGREYDQIVRPPLGHVGRAGRQDRASSPSRSSAARSPAPACRVTGGLVGDTPVQAVRRRRGNRPLGRRPDGLFRAARGGADRADLDQPRHLHGPRRRFGAARQPHRGQRRHRHICRPCRPTAGPWPTCRWPAPATRPTARC